MEPSQEKIEKISLPLYAGAFAATLCGILTVADSVGDSAFTQEAVALTCVGFAFSLGCRALRISARLVQWLCVGLIVAAAMGAMSGRVDWGSLVPPSVGTNDARVAVLLCWGAVLLSWVLLNDASVLFTPLLAVAAIGLVASFDLNTYVAAYFVLFLASSVFLLTHYQSLRLRGGATAPGADDQRNSLLGQLSLAALCSLGVLALGLTLTAPVEALAHNLSLAGAIKRLANIASGHSSSGSASRFSDDANFDIGTGMGWSASANVLARVTPSDGLPHLWRGRTYDQYNGDGWQSTLSGQWLDMNVPQGDGSGNAVYALPTASYPGRPILRANFEMVGETDEFYYATDPRRLILPAEVAIPPRLCVDGRLDLSDERPLLRMRYSVVSQLTPDSMDPFVQRQLRHASAQYPPFIRAHYLGNMDSALDDDLNGQAPAYFRKAVAAALQGLPVDQQTPIDKALAIRAWVSNHCVYSLNVAAIPLADDHVYQFLAHTRRGYCDLFASSMAVLCRVAGIPARVATGFAPGQPVGSTYDLRAMDRHAWTEVYFPGYGWLDFDATMGTRTDGSVPNSHAGAGFSWTAFLNRLGIWPIFLGALILLILLYVGISEWNQYRQRRAVHAQKLARSHLRDWERRYRRLASALAGFGLVRGMAETPQAFARRAVQFLQTNAPSDDGFALIERLTDDFSRGRYSPQPSPGDPALEPALRRLASDGLKWRWRTLWQRLIRPRAAEFQKGTKSWN
jgi:transglutaminase-like putative cysteine protease